MKERVSKSTARSNLSMLVRNRWIEFLYLVGIIVMSAGIVNAAIQPVDIRYIIYPGRDAQSISETVINAMALSMGFAGVYMSYLSGRQMVKPRMAGFYLVIGLLLLATAFYIGIYVYVSK